MGEWVGVAIIVGGLITAAIGSHLEKPEQRGEGKLTMIAIGMILAGIVLLGVLANMH
jgi:F0F1-type ATP synthase membrane subunit c/vacuolar-type H+-ATPase subunit K